MTDVHTTSDKLIKELKDIDQVVIDNDCGVYTEFDVQGGIIKMWTLHRDDFGHCILAHLPKGVTMPGHDHRFSSESIVLIRGAIDIEHDVNGEMKTRSMKKGRPAFLNEKQHHVVMAREESWVYTTMIPPDEQLK